MSNKHDGCYKSINGRLGKLHYHRGQNFTDAQKHCERVDNSQLAVMKDNATIYDVVASLESYPENRKCIERDFWIGLHKENDKYKWLDGGVWDQTITPVDNSYPGNCVQLYWVRGMKPRWSQENCSSLSAFLCYTSLTDEPLSTTTVTTFSTLRMTTSSTTHITTSSTPHMTTSPTPRMTTSLTPCMTTSSTLRMTTSSTPRMTTSSTPRMTTRSTPRMTTSLTPRMTTSSTPRMTTSSTTRMTTSSATRMTTSLTPPMTTSSTPRIYSNSSLLSESTATAASPQSVSPVLIGAIAGGVFALLLALILVMYFCRKRKQRNQNLSPAQNPEVNMSLNFNPMYEESAQEKINPIYNMDIELRLQPEDASLNLNPQACGSNDVIPVNGDVTPDQNINMNPSPKNEVSFTPDVPYAKVNKKK
uniref:uncharacterized protein DDB_G0290587-like n=1 Tax=Ciona intestinalis TaxID=7719 RepID=UPI000521620B|nr:uncharacterized protein DDB_G0290587-like [Ciona intestinalis]|eukprot:XP_009857854.1 uncharacterized protein DDB_G0290587-like [Ciona intestinalis]